ncbi:MAG: F0F1 ATP synthase subunit delta [Patescibacteria group bacterium]
MENAYAQALMRMMSRGMNPKDAVAALHTLLVRLGRESLLPKIGRAFGRLAEREGGRTGITLTVARHKDTHAAQHAIKDILSKMKTDTDEVVVRTDDSLIGGWRLEGRERLIDASFKKYLLSLYNRATQS